MNTCEVYILFISCFATVAIATINEPNKAFDIDDWNTYEDIVDQLFEWQSQCPGGIYCGTFSRGSTAEFESVYGFTMGTGEGNPTVWVDGLTHGRDWLSGSTVLYMIHYMVSSYNTDDNVKRLVDNYEWVFIPTINPDGYLQTYTGDRTWRKNMQFTQGTTCVGTDLNRNFDTGFWGTQEPDSAPCSETFHGTGPASAPETGLVQEGMSDLSDLKVMLSFYSSGGAQWLYPWGELEGLQCKAADNQADLRRVGLAAIAAVMNSGTRPNDDMWSTGCFGENVYPASGLAIDYAESIGVEYPFLVELSGQAFGFESPVQDIEPTFRETWEGVVAMFDEINRLEN